MSQNVCPICKNRWKSDRAARVCPNCKVNLKVARQLEKEASEGNIHPSENTEISNTEGYESLKTENAIDEIIGKGSPEKKEKKNMDEGKQITGKAKDTYTCGECNTNLGGKVTYCPNCGCEFEWD